MWQKYQNTPFTFQSLLHGYAIFELSVRKIFSPQNRQKLLILVILLFVPLLSVISISVHYPRGDVKLMLSQFINLFYLYYIFLFLTPFCTLFVLTAIYEEIEDGTLAFYLMQPITRQEIYFWKFLAYFVFSTVIFIIPVTIYFVSLANKLEIEMGLVILNLFTAWLMIIVVILTLGSFFFFISTIAKKGAQVCMIGGYALTGIVTNFQTTFISYWDPGFETGTTIPLLLIFIVLMLVAGIYSFMRMDVA
ncbi:MAG: ABC transporter permease subunit [Promethearchaeota archaeon]